MDDLTYSYVGLKREVDDSKFLVKMMEDLLKREIAELQKSTHVMLMRQKYLAEVIHNLRYKIRIWGGDPDQLELEI